MNFFRRAADFAANGLTFPWRMANHLWGLRELTLRFVWREFMSRYRGAHLGILLSLASPLILLVVYTLIFGVIFQGSFGQDGGKAPFALALFSALIFFQLFSDTVGRSTSLLPSNPGFITKVVFPLEILPVALLGSALLHFFAGLLILFAGLLLLNHSLPWTVILFPALLLPMLLLSLGLAWFLSALGLYFRDLDAVVPPVLMALTFLSAIFYPLSAIPERFQVFALLNPLVGFSEMSRAIFIFGEIPDWRVWLYCLGISIVSALVGYFVFTRLKKGFSDAL